MLEGVPQNLAIAGFCIYGVVMLLKALREFMPTKAQQRALSRTADVSLPPERLQMPAAATSADSVGNSHMGERLEELRQDLKDGFTRVEGAFTRMEKTQEEHGRLLGKLRERVAGLEGRAGAEATGRHQAQE